MPEVNGANAAEAWQAGSAVLATSGTHLYNLLVTIDDPTYFDPAWLQTYDPRSVLDSGDRLPDVINTILPYRMLRRHANRNDFYNAYIRAHERAKSLGRHRSAWGTYIERLIRFGTGGPNQLETVITKLNSWPRRSRTGLVFHLSGHHLDGPRTRGGPCWQYGELLWRKDNYLDFVVVYRNHDYFNKALGNFIGLGHLLKFICDQSGKRPGRLTCHSVHAYFDVPLPAFRALSRLD